MLAPTYLLGCRGQLCDCGRMSSDRLVRRCDRDTSDVTGPGVIAKRHHYTEELFMNEQHKGELVPRKGVGDDARMLIDPVCGMAVDGSSPHHVVLEGHDYWLCSSSCRAKFEADPARYGSAKRLQP